jgi:hypothetical protein
VGTKASAPKIQRAELLALARSGLAKDEGLETLAREDLELALITEVKRLFEDPERYVDWFNELPPEEIRTLRRLSAKGEAA